jgi:hypothetical protein
VICHVVDVGCALVSLCRSPAIFFGVPGERWLNVCVFVFITSVRKNFKRASGVSHNPGTVMQIVRQQVQT